MDVNLPKADNDISGPKVDIEGPDVSYEGPEREAQGPKFKMPEMVIKSPRSPCLSIGLNLKRLK